MASSAATQWADRRIQSGGESLVPVAHRREALLRWRRLSLYLRSVTAFREILQERRLFGVERRAADVDKGVIHPHHPFFRFWDLLLFLCTTYNVLFIPIRLCFRTSGDSADVAVAYTTDIVYLIDIVIRFRTGFMVRCRHCQSATLCGPVRQRRSRARAMLTDCLFASRCSSKAISFKT